MTKQLINIGTTANDAKGDTLRVGAEKINSNFTELYNTVAYTLPPAGVGPNSTLGGVRIDGTTIQVSGGVISAPALTPYSLPVATTSLLGGVKVDGTTITITSGVISATPNYVLPSASTTVKGGVKIDGTTIQINNGIISAPALTPYSLPVATTSLLGGVKVDGTTITISGSGVISGANTYTLPTASTTIKGGVKVDGTSIVINGQTISGFSGSYADLTNKPTIPSLTGYATETYVTTRGYLTSVGTISYTDLSNKPALFSGSYTDLTDKPTIPGAYTLPTASTSVLGGVKIDGSTITLNGSNQLVANYTTYSLPTASTTVLGGVKVDGTTIQISNGVISSPNSSRTTVNVSSATLLAGASGTYSITGFKSYVLFKIQTSAAAWVTLYTDTASRSADASRVSGTDPLPGSGVIAEIITTGAQTILISPGTFGFNNETIPTTAIPIKIVNTGVSSAAITVTLTVLNLEA